MTRAAIFFSVVRISRPPFLCFPLRIMAVPSFAYVLPLHTLLLCAALTLFPFLPSPPSLVERMPLAVLPLPWEIGSSGMRPSRCHPFHGRFGDLSGNFPVLVRQYSSRNIDKSGLRHIVFPGPSSPSHGRSAQAMPVSCLTRPREPVLSLPPTLLPRHGPGT